MIIWVFILTIFLSGCQTTAGNVGMLTSYPFNEVEPQWIRNGEPIKYNGELWYPVDGIECLQDSEVLPIGVYRGVQFFIDKIDVKPYNRLYTKFGRNKFRIFEKR